MGGAAELLMKLFSEIPGEPVSPQIEEELTHIRRNLSGVRATIAFASAKGGVGKSAILTNVAAALALKGRKVAVLDADLNSPSVPAMLGLRRVRLYVGDNVIDPAAGPLGLRVVASNLLMEPGPPAISLLEEEPPIVPADNGVSPVELTASQMIRRLFAQTRFGVLDFVLVDLAPGLGELDMVARNAPLSGIVLVSHPSALGVQAARGALELAAQIRVPVVGIIENMTGFFCGNCHAVRPLMPRDDMDGLARDKGVSIIARLPFDPRLAETCDHGTAFVREYADSPLAKHLNEIASRLEETLGLQARGGES
jgi:ATP-binding protein involved in chromosome partitioning